MSRRGASRGELVLGLMSGTSADGIDVALVRISRRSASLEGFYSTAYPSRVRDAILRIANVGATTSAEISQLDFLLGELYARAVLAALRKCRVAPSRISLVGSHGQTIYHQGKASNFLGAGRVASTLQIGEPAVIAARTGITTVGRFSSGRHGRGGTGSAARAVCRLSRLSPCDDGPRGAEHRRDR